MSEKAYDRADAVNLATNILMSIESFTITPYGLCKLAADVLAMDAELKRTAAQHVVPSGSADEIVDAHAASTGTLAVSAAHTSRTPETDAHVSPWKLDGCYGEIVSAEFARALELRLRAAENDLVISRACHDYSHAQLEAAEREHQMDMQVVAQFKERAEAAERELKAITGDLDFKPDDQYKIADMANVGHAFLREIAANIPKYCYNDSPAEIICELLDKATDAERELAELKAAMESARGELPSIYEARQRMGGGVGCISAEEMHAAATAAIASRDLRITKLKADKEALDWLERLDGDFHNIDRITSVRGKFNGLPSLREAIDKSRTSTGEGENG